MILSRPVLVTQIFRRRNIQSPHVTLASTALLSCAGRRVCSLLPLRSSALGYRATDHRIFQCAQPSAWTPAAAQRACSATVLGQRHSSGATAAAGSGANQMVMVRESIELTPVEKELFDTLLEAVKLAGTGTVLRCAGGWVRDKLLGRSSSDIDIALDNVLGKDFAEHVNQYLAAQGKATRHAAVIQSNPEQSKHLETARMKINDQWIDLVNLRSESYASDSRIPIMEFGTPEQDALRRDFTINSLFYNITTGLVEDFTGRGLEDLRAGIMRTPLPAIETFQDDPLRVLRAIRFATRFNFILEDTLLDAAGSDKVRVALGQKISKERIGTELEGMFNGASPLAAMQLIHRLRLFPVVFSVPAPLCDVLGPLYGEPCVRCMEAGDAALQAQPSIQLDSEEKRTLQIAAMLLPLRACEAPGAKGKMQAASVVILRESIKWRAKDGDNVQMLHDTAAELVRIAGMLDQGTQQTPSLSASAEGTAGESPAAAQLSGHVRVVFGNAIRKMKQHWRIGVLLAPLLTLQCASPLGVESGRTGQKGGATRAGDAGSRADSDVAGGDSEHPDADMSPQSQARRNEMASQLFSAATAFGLENCWQWKPLMDGKQVMTLLGLTKPGPELGKTMAVVMDWQLMNPGGTLEDCQKYVLQQHK